VNYHPGMIRSLGVTTAAVGLAFGGTAVAGAEPSAVACSYTLSPPHVVQVSGTDMVTATLSTAGCDQSNTYLSVACIQVQGGQGPGQCAQGEGLLTAQVYFGPYRPGATYVSTGRGCASKGNPPRPFCESTGPLTATL
jgi:hypothetical protein